MVRMARREGKEVEVMMVSLATGFLNKRGRLGGFFFGFENSV